MATSYRGTLGALSLSLGPRIRRAALRGTVNGAQYGYSKVRELGGFASEAQRTHHERRLDRRVERGGTRVQPVCCAQLPRRTDANAAYK